ncbi:metal-dependent hydrolase family protein [Terrabacter terrigena]|uniref:Amidohydrolase family protein n=1 Tax=Terrabacter terrigena TaxID=574718 RepID=A0ABW3N3A5_9MICO
MSDRLTTPQYSDDLVLSNGVALVGEALDARPFQRMLVRDGRVATFDGEGGDSSAPTLDLQGQFVLPGLIDCHVHFDLAAAPAAYDHWTKGPLVRSLTCLHNGLLALSRGITAVRDLGCADHLVLEYAAQVDSGVLLGPRVVAAGRPITVTGGHFCRYARVADGATEVRKAVREQVGAGAKVIKLMATGGISTPGDPHASQLTVDEMTAAVEEAHQRGVPVAAHAHSPAGVRNALAAGVDTIEHAAFIDDAALEALSRSRATLVPTVSALNNIGGGLGIPEATVEKSLSARGTYRQSTQRAIRAGVRIAAGTDAGTALNPIGGLVDELAMYCDAGMTPVEALQSATSRAGAVLGDGLGVLDLGSPADMVIVKRDPRRDLDALREPAYVVSRGRLVPMPWVQEALRQLSEATKP